MEWRCGGDTWHRICGKASDVARADGMDAELKGKPQVTNAALSRFLHVTEDRWKRWLECAAFGAEALVGEARELIDKADASSNSAVSKSRAQAEQRRWEAGKIDRTAWGDAPAVALTLNVNDLHLTALRSAQRPRVSEAVEVVVEGAVSLPSPAVGCLPETP